MVASRKIKLPEQAPPVVERRSNRLLCCNDSPCDTATPTDGGLATWQALRVLVVDHQQVIAGGRLSLFTSWGHTVRLAHDSQAGLIAAAAQQPNVVLLNLELPSMDGCHWARQLRLNAPGIECLIIAMADWSDGERRRQCSEAGIDLLFVDPVAPADLEMLLGLEWVRIHRRSHCGHRQTNAAEQRADAELARHAGCRKG